MFTDSSMMSISHIDASVPRLFNSQRVDSKELADFWRALPAASSTGTVSFQIRTDGDIGKGSQPEDT